MLDNYAVGQEVTVSFNLKGRKWVNPQGATKYFNSLQAWRMQPASDAAANSTAMPTTDSASASANPASSGTGDPMISAGEGEDDDLPF